MDLTSATTAIRGRRLLLAVACGLALLPAALVDSARGQGLAASADVLSAGSAAPDSASLVQCLTTGEQAERSATFAGEMTAIAGTTRMSMRIELLEWMPGQTSYHVVAAPGLGVWRVSDPGVGVYKYVKQVTNLSPPADYRGLVSFRWQGAHGHTIKRDERRTRRCSQPAPAASAPSLSSSLE
ncbi:MAG TPA: hypothetical protein VGH60_09110 [Solirubrobacteraceae bacterium]|jgi:hypothetical protein